MVIDTLAQFKGTRAGAAGPPCPSPSPAAGSRAGAVPGTRLARRARCPAFPWPVDPGARVAGGADGLVPWDPVFLESRDRGGSSPWSPDTLEPRRLETEGARPLEALGPRSLAIPQPRRLLDLDTSAPGAA